MDHFTLYYALKTLTAFPSVLETPALTALLRLLETLCSPQESLPPAERLSALDSWRELVSALNAGGFDSLDGILTQALRDSDDPWPQAVSQNRETPFLEAQARRDTETLSALAGLDPEGLRNLLCRLLPAEARPAAEKLSLWRPGGPIELPPLKEWYQVHGTGLFARYQAFLWENGVLLPVEAPDVPHQSELKGYHRQREQVEANTRALLAGKQVNNVLLFGDSGTGKSATVKSLLGLPGTGELRLIEVEKESVAQMPRLIRSLAGRRQKFILFIDDLAFDQDDMTYSVLKTILEGGLESRPANVAIYATSNRRNLVRQTFSSRAGDEVDRDETIQEKTALADRFGLRIAYLGLTKEEYLVLVKHLAQRAGIGLSEAELTAQAIRWDVRHPGRSPRTAQQFIASLEG